jgi:hypothetical protein
VISSSQRYNKYLKSSQKQVTKIAKKWVLEWSKVIPKETYKQLAIRFLLYLNSVLILINSGIKEMSYPHLLGQAFGAHFPRFLGRRACPIRADLNRYL